MRPHLVVDGRKAFDAGIGTYIRNVVPLVIERLGPDVDVAVLMQPRSEQGLDWLPHQTRRTDIGAGPLGAAEQFELRAKLVDATLFWATSLAHPLGWRGPLVATVHDVAQLALTSVDGIQPHVRWMARAFLTSQRKHARALIAVSEFTRHEFVRCVGQPRCGDIAVTPLGVDAAWFDTASRGNEHVSPYLVCVGSVRPHKNIARLVEAFGQVAGRMPHRLIIVGRLQSSDAPESWLAALPQAARSRVRFTGHVADVELRSLIAGADALVFPSLYEGFGLPALEAMAAGCPVLASNASALAEVCGGAAAGYFDPRSVSALANALLAHVQLAPAARHAIVDRGIAHARAFTWERTADLTARVMEGALRCAS